MRFATRSSATSSLRFIFILLIATARPSAAQRVHLTIGGASQSIPLSRIHESLQWHALQPGLGWSEAQLHAGVLHLPVRVVIARIDPRFFDMQLALATRANGMTGVWNVDSAAAGVAFAFNAGQFKETGPWGWLVMQSYERRDPGFGPLSVGVAIGKDGALRWIEPDALRDARRDGSIRFAFQSYPLLLLDHRVPPLLSSSDDVDRDHRDARLILAEADDGALLVVLTRCDAFDGAAARVPIGLTLPESLALVRALGARNAVMLDGGLSAQLMLRDSTGAAHAWKGLRNVPLALVGRRRDR